MIDPKMTGPKLNTTARPATTLAERLNPRDNAYTLLRLLAALAVVATHAMTMGIGPQAVGPLGGWTPYDAGQHAVNLFFVLSGIMVFASIERSASLLDFLVKRALRIYPALAVCLVLIVLLVRPALTSAGWADYFGRQETWSFIPMMLLVPSEQHQLPGLFATLPTAGAVNVPLWTIKYEVFMYLVLAGLAAIGMLGGPLRRGLSIAALLAPFMAISAVPSLAGALADASTSLVHLARFAFCFGLGMLAYVLRDQLVLSGKAATGLLAFTMVASLLAAHYRPDVMAMLAPLWMLALGYGAVVLGARPLGRAGAFARRSDLSYGVYIYGWVASQILLTLLPGIGSVSLMLASLLASLALAHLSWMLVEKPALAFKPREDRLSPRTMDTGHRPQPASR